MDVITAKNILSKVLPSFIKYFRLLEDEVQFDLKKENEFLSTEISEFLCNDFSNWVSNYVRVGNENSNQVPLKKKLELRKEDNFIKPGILFTRYYANLFYGVHQAAEIDALRMAISDLDNPLHQQWALGALTATISYCAYSYAGHFAQPKINLSKTGDTNKQIKAILKKRSISVQHEFSARLLSLAEESEKTSHDIQDVEGPWENALLKIDQLVKDTDVLVYLDPPYTRDEFSRYYHVLETLIHYNYPETSGKATVPLKGSKGRFRSKFFSRNTANIEGLLVEIMSECLKREWSCLWSYSSSGLANISKVLLQLESQTSCIEIFSANHSYAPQGKQKAKRVVEYFILLKS
jgi:adenine-specific DNA methylase